MKKDLVSIIMLSHEGGKYVKETVESVLAQTYQNWELLFVDDNSQDDTIEQMMDLNGKDKRFNISRSVYDKGMSYLRNSALKQARGRWMAFLDVGDVWAPEKLEKQIAFMEEHGYAFSYTKYGIMNEKSQKRDVVIGGKAHITYQDMQKCCWPSYLTVMYDAKKVGKMRVRNLGKNNDYALWLNVCEKADCHLLDENLATLRTEWSIWGKIFLTNKFKWRYDCFRVEEDLSPVTASLFAIRNGFYGLVKWFKYVKRG
jgi:glycosyltransferase involved in cell wall biosynthesis